MTDVEAPPRIEHRFAPQGGCFDLFLDRSPELLVSGPAGTGKSRACLEKLHFVALHNPGMRGLLSHGATVNNELTPTIHDRENNPITHHENSLPPLALDWRRSFPGPDADARSRQ